MCGRYEFQVNSKGFGHVLTLSGDLFLPDRRPDRLRADHPIPRWSAPPLLGEVGTDSLLVKSGKPSGKHLQRPYRNCYRETDVPVGVSEASLLGSDRVVVAVPAEAQARFQAVRFQESRSGMARVLAALVGMDDHLLLRNDVDNERSNSDSRTDPAKKRISEGQELWWSQIDELVNN